MKSLNSQKRRLSKILVISSVLVFLYGAKAGVHSGILEGLQGPPFSVLSEIMEMPDTWKKQPVKYDPTAGNVDLTVSLDQQMYPAYKSIIQEYARKHNLKIAVNNGTCGISSGVLSRKAVDVGGFCCPPGMTDRLPGLRFHTIGIAALALIVHPENNIDNVTTEQARQIFMGEIYRWSELKTADGKKGVNLPIQPVGRLHCKLRPGHWRLLLDNEDLFSPGIIEVGAIPDMITKVSVDLRAIGYETMLMTQRYQNQGIVKALKINNYDPRNSSHLLSMKYPLYRVYNLTTWEGEAVENPVAKKLVKYLSQQAEHIGSRFSIIPSSRLREAGWKFQEDELVGEPG
jgi:ABC-type phosphate transport system substrate-binding protein